MHPTVWGQRCLLLRKRERERDGEQEEGEKQMLPQEEGWAAHLFSPFIPPLLILRAYGR